MKSKKPDNVMQLGYGAVFELDADGLVSKLTFSDATPQDQVAIDGHVRAVQEARGRVPRSPADSGAAIEQKAPQASILTLRAAVDDYLENAKNIKASTLKNYTGILNKVVIPYFGENRLITDIDQALFAKFVDNVAARDRARSTKESYLAVLMAMLEWHHIRGRSTQVLTVGDLLPRSRSPASDKSRAFSLDELRAIVQNASRYIHHTPAKFWATVLPMFTGTRIEEIAQLNLRSDLKCHDEAGSKTYYIRIDEVMDEDEGSREKKPLDKSVKSPAGWRNVPLHSALVRHGAIAYLERQRDLQLERGRGQWQGRPFVPTFLPYVMVKKKGDPKWSQYTAKWGSAELKRLAAAGLVQRVKSNDGGGFKEGYFRSLRPTFNTHLASKGVGHEMRSVLCGQQFGAINAEVYNKMRHDPAYIPQLAQVIEDNLDEFVAILDECMANLPEQAAKQRRGRPRKSTN